MNYLDTPKFHVEPFLIEEADSVNPDLSAEIQSLLDDPRRHLLSKLFSRKEVKLRLVLHEDRGDRLELLDIIEWHFRAFKEKGYQLSDNGDGSVTFKTPNGEDIDPDLVLYTLDQIYRCSNGLGYHFKLAR